MVEKDRWFSDGFKANQNPNLPARVRQKSHVRLYSVRTLRRPATGPVRWKGIAPLKRSWWKEKEDLLLDFLSGYHLTADQSNEHKMKPTKERLLDIRRYRVCR